MSQDKVEQRRVSNRASYWRHREAQLAKKREWRLAHAARMKQLNAEWYQRNRDRAVAARRAYRKKYREKCRALVTAWYHRNKPRVKKYRLANRTKILSQQLYRRTGCTQEQYQEFLEQQSKRCAICHNLPGRRKLVVDHCHETGMLRGLLCFNCNVLLGCAKDNVEVLQSAIAYLTKQ